MKNEIEIVNLNNDEENQPIPFRIMGFPVNEDCKIERIYFGMGHALGSKIGIFYGSFITRAKHFKKARLVLSNAIEGKQHYPAKYCEASLLNISRGKQGLVFSAQTHEKRNNNPKAVCIGLKVGFLYGSFWTSLEDAKKLLDLMDAALEESSKVDARSGIMS